MLREKIEDVHRITLVEYPMSDGIVLGNSGFGRMKFLSPCPH
jgi:hypothetical protein